MQPTQVSDLRTVFPFWREIRGVLFGKPQLQFCRKGYLKNRAVFRNGVKQQPSHLNGGEAGHKGTQFACFHENESSMFNKLGYQTAVQSSGKSSHTNSHYSSKNATKIKIKSLKGRGGDSKKSQYNHTVREQEAGFAAGNRLDRAAPLLAEEGLRATIRILYRGRV